MNSENVMVAELDDWIDGVLVLDKGGNVLSINSTVTDKLGWVIEDVKSKHIHEVLCAHSIYTDHAQDECPLSNSELEIQQPIETYWTHKNQSNVAVTYRKKSKADCSFIVFNTCKDIGVQVEELKKISVFTEINPHPCLSSMNWRKFNLAIQL